MSIALILAAGEQSRWEMDKPPYHKQLLDVGGETIIERIVRQCRARNVGPLVISHHEGILSSPFRANCFSVKPHRWTVETLHSARDLWQDCAIVLLGDTVYSKATMDRIFNAPEQKLCVFGNGVEIYALVMRPQMPGRNIIKTCEEVIVGAEQGLNPGKLRSLYQAYCNLPPNASPHAEKKVLQWVHGVDYTRDVDLPEDYQKLIRTVIKPGRLDDL